MSKNTWTFILTHTRIYLQYKQAFNKYSERVRTDNGTSRDDAMDNIPTRPATPIIELIYIKYVAIFFHCLLLLVVILNYLRKY